MTPYDEIRALLTLTMTPAFMREAMAVAKEECRARRRDVEELGRLVRQSS